MQFAYYATGKFMNGRMWILIDTISQAAKGHETRLSAHNLRVFSCIKHFQLTLFFKNTSYVKAIFTHTWIFLKLEYPTFVLKNILVHMKMEKKNKKNKEHAKLKGTDI